MPSADGLKGALKMHAAGIIQKQNFTNVPKLPSIRAIVAERQKRHAKSKDTSKNLEPIHESVDESDDRKRRRNG